MDWAHVVSAELARLALCVLGMVILYKLELVHRELK